jgi:hypothetical protein
MLEADQTDIRIEKHLLKGLKAFADRKDLTLGDLLEGVVPLGFEGNTPFGGNRFSKWALSKKSTT